MPHPTVLVVSACVLDRLVGDPRRFLHPVQVMGWCIQRLQQFSEAWAGDIPWKLRLAGGVLATMVTVGSGLAGWLLEQWARDKPLIGSILVVIGLGSALAGRSLEQAVREVLDALPDLEEARAKLRWIVGREVEGLPEKEILRATAESTAENSVDGLFAPLFWILVGASISAHWPGAPGPLAFAWSYKASSTLDSMLGYRRGRLLWLGTAGARLDDGLTWIPCRLVALTLPLTTGRPWRCLPLFFKALGDGADDPSPNAGISEAAFAHAVEARLGGWNRYADGWRQKPTLGSEYSAPDKGSIHRMLNLSLRLEFLWVCIFIFIDLVISR